MNTKSGWSDPGVAPPLGVDTTHTGIKITYAPIEDAALYGPLSEIGKLLHTPQNWNGQGSAPPNEFAVRNARRLLRSLRQGKVALPHRILASADGGVALVYDLPQHRYASIDCLNTGGTVAGFDGPDMQPLVFSVEPDRPTQLLERLSESGM